MRGRTFSPEQITRSGERQSNRERRARTERRHHVRGGPDDQRYGIQLQRAVSERLDLLDIGHERYENGHPVARSERVELIIDTPLRRTHRIKLQYTLRRGTLPKILDFLVAALTGEDADVPRVYLEIDAPRGMQVRDLAERVAYAIRKIVQEIRDLPRDVGNVVGLTLDAARKNWRDALSPLSLVGMLDNAARAALAAAVRIAQEARALAAAAKRAKAAASKPFFRRLMDVLPDHFVGFVPSPAPAYAQSRRIFPRRMPFRR